MTTTMSVALNVPAGTAEDVSGALKAFRAGTGSVPVDLYVERYARLVWAVATMIARNVPWRTMSHDPATGAIVSEDDMTKPICMDVVVYAQFVDIVHHQEDRVATQRLRAVEAETALREARAALGDRLDRERAEFERGRAEGEAGAREELERLRAALRQAHERIARMEQDLALYGAGG